jgi:phosphate/sulfate permease
VNWNKAAEVFLALLVSPLVGFGLAALLLLGMLWLLPNPILYQPLDNIKSPPPPWIRGTLIFSCGAVSYAHGSNDGQKGMGLLLLVLVGFLPFAYALDTNNPERAQEVYRAATHALEEVEASEVLNHEALRNDLNRIRTELADKHSFNELESEKRWEVRQAIFRVERALNRFPPEARQHLNRELKTLRGAIEFVPFWVVIGVALALGIGTTIGYKRIVVTVAEKIGKKHLSYGQGMMAEVVAASTIMLATVSKMPVSTTQVLSSGVAGTMWATGSGLQAATTRKILLAWVLTLPVSMALAGGIYCLGRLLLG